MTAPTNEFKATIELLLLVLGGAMTLGVLVVAVFLFRTMRREDREEAEREDSAP